MKYIKLIFTKAIFLYLVLGAALWYTPWFYTARAHAIAQVLTRLHPHINYFEDFANPHEHFSIDQLNLCINYHKRVVQFIPLEGPEAYQMIGYCYNLLGDRANAEKFYQMSTKTMPGPNYFWPYYNLGILAFNKGDNSRAVDYFQKALVRYEVVNHWLWTHSKVFNDVRISDPANADYNFSENFRKSYTQAYILLLESIVRLKSYDELFKVIPLALKDAWGEQDVFYYYGGVGDFYRRNYKEALIFLHLAVNLNPNNSDAILYMGKCMQAIGRPDLADNLFSQAENVKQRDGPFMEKRLNPSIRFF